MSELEFSGSDSEEEGSGPSSFPLHDAAQAGNAELLRELLQPPAAPQPSAEELAGLNDVLARYVIEAAQPQLPDVDHRDHQECTPLHVALLHGQLEAARVLLEHGASLEKACEGSPPLHIAVCVGAHSTKHAFSLQAIALLLQFGAVPYERDDNGRTVLHWAAQLDLTEAAQVLLQAAAAQRQKLRQEAAAAAATAAAAAAADGGAAVPGGEGDDGSVPPPLVLFQDKQGSTAVHLAARQGHPASLQLLLEAASGEGDSSGPAAAEAGAGSSVLHALCKTKNKAGMTALHMAALAGCLRCAALLVAADPDLVGAKNKLGLTAADLAARRRHTALEAALRSTQPADQLAAALKAQEGQEQQQPRTLLVAPPECLVHYTCPAPITRETSDSAPPENVDRLTVLTKPDWGILRTQEFAGGLAWDERSQRAALADVLRVHDWNYVRRIQAVCDSLPDDPEAIGHLDGDTAVSRGTFRAALAAAGAVCTAVDAVMGGQVANAFCAVRPPGHHAGPLGVVSNANDPNGSHGFCLFNNAAIGAAYAMNVYRHAGVRRVAILDFDVHHGNGTEACVTNTIPSTSAYKFSTPYSEGTQAFAVYKPWLDSTDRDCIFFASVQGYGPKAPNYPAYVYPGSGATCDTKLLAEAKAKAAAEAEAAAAAAAAAGGAAAADPAAANGQAGSGQQQQEGAEPAAAAAMDVDGPAGQQQQNGVAPAANWQDSIEEDPDHEFRYTGGQVPPPEGPRVIDIGIPGFGPKPALWRRSWRDKILPAVANFKPDMIFICAGFDAHKKDEINFRYIGVTERDFEWLTEQLVALANRCCQGRVVSVMEGGYRIQGGVMSAFARSVAAHVKALMEPNSAVWDPQDAKAEREHEKKVRAELEAKRIEQQLQKAARAREAAAQRAAAVAAAAAAAAAAQQAAAAPAEPTAAAPSQASAAAPAAAPATAEAAAPAAAPPAAADEAEDGGRKRRRRGGGVDYVALNKQLEEEAAARRVATGGSGS